MSFKTRPHYNVTCSNRIEVMKVHVAFSLNVPGYFADDIIHVDSVTPLWLTIS